MLADETEIVSFGPFRVNVAQNTLTHQQIGPIHLPKRTLEVLVHLAGARGQVVPKQAVMSVVWHGRTVSEQNITVHIARLRQVLGEEWVQTVPGRGYRLVTRPKAKAAAPVHETSGPVVAVLPFVNVGDDPEQEYFADGITEDIITAVGRLRWFPVIARNSAFTYKGRMVGVMQVGRELGVRYVLTGSVRRAGGRLRITGQLANAETGAMVWADRYEGTLENVFELQDSVAAAVAAAMEPKLQLAEMERTRRNPPESLGAYERYLQALPTLHAPTRDGVAAGLRLMEETMQLFPDYALAYALAALGHLFNVLQGYSDDPVRDRQTGGRLARTAVALDRNDPMVLSMAGHALCYHTGDWETALSLLDRSLALNPHSVSAHRSAGWTSCFAGDPDRAVGHFKVALRLSPVDSTAFDYRAGYSLALVMQGQDEDAVAQARQAVLEAPGWTSSYRPLAASLAHLGRLEEAREVVRQMLRIQPSYRILRETLHFRHCVGLQRLREGLRMAGLPD